LSTSIAFAAGMAVWCGFTMSCGGSVTSPASPHKVVGAWTDITERKQLETHLLRTQRLECVGRLASGIAHDLNNILASVFLASQLLREKANDQDYPKLLDVLDTNAKRGANIVKQLLIFGRGLEAVRAPMQLRNLVNDMANIIQETFPKNIVFQSEAPAQTWMVNGDATQLHQLLMNLCINAADAMPRAARSP